MARFVRIWVGPHRRAPLAGADTCILFTRGGPDAALDADARAEIDRILVEGGVVHILGGTNAVSQQAEDELRNARYSIDRIAGETRIETAIELARRVLMINPTSTALLAFAYNWPDAVTGGAFGAASLTPIMLTETAQLTATTDRALDDLGITTTSLVGGAGVVSDAAMAAAPGGVRIAGVQPHGDRRRCGDLPVADRAGQRQRLRVRQPRTRGLMAARAVRRAAVGAARWPADGHRRGLLPPGDVGLLGRWTSRACPRRH